MESGIIPFFSFPHYPVLFLDKSNLLYLRCLLYELQMLEVLLCACSSIVRSEEHSITSVSCCASSTPQSDHVNIAEGSSSECH